MYLYVTIFLYICIMLFPGLKFTEYPHGYTLDGKEIPSMSSVLSKLSDKFNLEAASYNSAKKKGVEQDVIKKQWQFINESAVYGGHNTHNYGENGGNVDSKHKEAVQQYLHNLPSYYKIVAKEIRMYTRKYWIAGTADLLLQDLRDGSFIISDYKTNKDLFKTYNDDLHYPFDDYINSPYNKYIIQTNGYQIMLEEAGLVVKERHVVWVAKRSASAMYTLFKLPDVTDKLKLYYTDVRKS